MNQRQLSEGCFDARNDRFVSATERSGRLARFQAKSLPGAFHSQHNFAHTTTGLHQSMGIGGPVQRELPMDQGAQAAISGKAISAKRSTIARFSAGERDFITVPCRRR